MEEYIGIVAEKYGDTYRTPESGHVKGATLVKVDYNGNIIGEEPVGNHLPGLRLIFKTIFDPSMHYLVTPNELKTSGLLSMAGKENIGIGTGKNISDVVSELKERDAPGLKEALAPGR